MYQSSKIILESEGMFFCTTLASGRVVIFGRGMVTFARTYFVLPSAAVTLYFTIATVLCKSHLLISLASIAEYVSHVKVWMEILRVSLSRSAFSSAFGARGSTNLTG